MSLLEKAKKSSSSRGAKPVNEETLELALAWCRGEVTMGQCAEALGVSSPGATSTLLRALGVAVQSGRLTVTKT